MYIEIGIVLCLTLLNGLLAMSELAIVSARTARLQLMADRGSKGAVTAIRLAADPGRFLSSVQIGITLVGVLSGAFSGATLGARLSDFLLAQGVSSGVALPLGVGSVVVAITYLSLIVGELVPKQIALRAPEAVAARVAPMMQLVATVAAPLIWVLDRSGKLVLRLLGQSGDQAQQVSDEEVRLIISEAESAGAMKPAETRMIAGVMRIADRSARGLMTPRSDVEMLPLDLDRAGLLERLDRLTRSKLPVWEGEPDNIVGVLVARDLLVADRGGDGFDLRAVLREAPVVRDGQGALDVIENLRRAPAHMVLVYDEYGHFEGIITPMDVLQAITGDFHEDGEAEPKMVTRKDGSLLVAGWMPVDEFADALGLQLEADRDYQTVAGMVLDRMGRLPQVGETLEEGAWRIEVVDLDGRRIDKLLVARRDGSG
ncbi:MAG: hemolysin family protein [Paracoccaceae bacterium]|jgi:putative hemolysin|uniref:hemolysin family protein n=1 Tax=unclassified Seohaeicola TaxID=2641111 RepID=UPI00237A3F0F|nr:MULTISPECIES: hemolysin family protein [unclassified Seohaeicola]MDD9707476.1 hemolysin family protein [Seohaeicola sp. 4SK31]MDD9735549.1 hemolysin family protein [Seohaeicola sp. SP36]MDF1708326.1 hemolysin family protein [Paracoccaceae bacterium]MDM7970012.1 hemolysin family protein [Paracoccaceae bacterium]